MRTIRMATGAPARTGPEILGPGPLGRKALEIRAPGPWVPGACGSEGKHLKV